PSRISHPVRRVEQLTGRPCTRSLSNSKVRWKTTQQMLTFPTLVVGGELLEPHPASLSGVHRRRSLPDDLDQNPLGPVTVELAVEDLFPRSKVELALGNGHDDFPAHDLSLQVGVGVVLTRSVVVVVVRVGIEGSELLQPHAEVVVQAALIVVDEHGTGYVHRVYQHNAFTHTALGHSVAHLRRDVY